MGRLITAKPLQYCSTCGEVFDDTLSIIQRAFLRMVSADRFGLLNAKSPINFDFFNDKVAPVESSLEEIAEKRALELMAQGKEIIIPISGGIDSTFILASFFGKLPKDQLTLVCRPISRATNPELFTFLKQEGYDWIEVDDLETYKSVIRGQLYISGNGGDVLFGANCHRFAPEFYNKDWKEGLAYFLRMRGVYVTMEKFDEVVEDMKAYAKYVGAPLEQFCEFAWLQNFGLNWTYTMASEAITAPKRVRGNIINFFEDSDFSGWSLARASKLREHNPWFDSVYYKPEMKDYIKKVLGLDLAHVNKQFIHGPNYYVEGIRVMDTDGVFAFSVPQGGDRSSLNRKVLKRYMKGQ